MKHWLPIFGCIFIFLAFLLAAGSPQETVVALPEYSSQVGEPCSTCHISPSGGGARTPRGQAWVGEGKPSIVPDLMSALELLGVRLEVDTADYEQVPESIPEAAPLQTDLTSENLHKWLLDYAGN